MLADHLFPAFDDAREVPSARPAPSAVLNYVWINQTPDSEIDRSSALCSVWLDYLDMAYANARLYPETPVLIWLDYDLLDDSTRFWVQSHAATLAPSNVRLRDLNEIDLYKKEKEGGVMDTPDVWQRANLTRLLTLEHCLRETDAEHVFYADFDVRDASMLDPHALHCLKEHGVVLGATEDEFIENSYFGFARAPKGWDRLRELIDLTYDQALLQKDQAHKVVSLRALHWASECGLQDAALLSIPVVEPMDYELPQNPFYVEHGINDPR